MTNKFVHLHLHSEYSLLDGLSKISKLMVHVKENGMDSVAITDHGAMYGVIEFYKKALKESVKPILGMEGYTTNIDHKERPERGKFKNYHLLLLAKDNEGYKNLMKLTSIAHLEGYYYRPRVDRQTLAKYSKGLICTSACAQGEVAQALIGENFDEAKKNAEWFLDVFGKDYYLEVQRHNYGAAAGLATNDIIKKDLKEMEGNEKKINTGVIKLSRLLGIPIVATNDAHYITKEDATAQDSLVCIATGKNVSDIQRLRFIDTPSFYVKSPDEMADLFSDLPESLENTLKVADACNTSLTLDKWFFPNYVLEEGRSADQELSDRANNGIKDKIPNFSKEAKERLDYELETIKQKGYAPYFLIMSDVANWAYDHGIITNTRGSAAGSLVSYCIGIVNLNPMDYNLPFERFLTPWRPSPPDIDFDIADDRREEIINYLIEKYGSDKVAQICTFGRMMARGAVRDIARVLGYPYSTGDRISKLIPIGMQGFPMFIDKALAETPELKTLYDSDADAKKILDLAKEVEGNARHISVHAAGVVIAPGEVTDFTPIQKEGNRIITQYDMESLDPNVSPGEAVGLLKFDLLGLRNLSILGGAIKIIKDGLGIDIELLKIPLDNEKTFKMLSRGDTMGVFQFSGTGMTRYLKELKPTRVEDLMAMVALFRPGPMQFIPEYIARKHDPSKVKYIDERMKSYMGASYGLMIYQEDCLFTAINIAGYTWEEADKFRKAIGKKIPEEMKKQHDKFIKGCVDNGMAENKAQELFDMIDKFAAYGFNKGHSASYGRVAYWTAYLKANYPVEFMTALLTAESGDIDKVSMAINECRRIGIKVLPPDINESSIDFTIVSDKDSLTGKAIRFGFSGIKNVGNAAIDAILEARTEKLFTSFPDFLARADARRVNKRVLESLIKVGALSSFGRRAALLASIDAIRAKVSKPKSLKGQQDLFGTKPGESVSIEPLTADISTPEFTDDEIQALERQLLGYSLSAKPVSDLISAIEHLATHKIYEISPHETIGDTVKIACVVTEVRIVVTKNSGAEMAFVKVEDGTGSIDLVIFPRLFKSTRDSWVNYKVLVASGKVDAREESPSIVVDSIETIAGLKEGDKVFIRVPNGASGEQLKKLKTLLMENPGIQGVTLVFEGNKKKITLPFSILWSEALAHQISGILEGTGSTVVQ